MLHRIVREDIERIAAAALPWDRLEGCTVLVSGANGFLPAYLVETILLLNDRRGKHPTRVIGVDRPGAVASNRFDHHAGRKDLILLSQDVCQPLTVDGEVHFVIHAAGLASPKYYGADPAAVIGVSTLGTWNLLALAREKKVESFLFFSSSEVYGRVENSGLPLREDHLGLLDPLEVRSCYAEGKRAGETMCVSWQHQFGVPCRIVRPFHTYGPGVDLEDGRVFAAFAADIVHRRDIRIKSDGTARRCFCYLADAAEAFFTVLLCGEIGRAYNVGNPQAELSVAELAGLLVGLFPERGCRVVFQHRPDDPAYIPSRISRITPDISRLADLGWRPVTAPAEGFERMVRSYL